jgi:hypothetical protein
VDHGTIVDDGTSEAVLRSLRGRCRTRRNHRVAVETVAALVSLLAGQLILSRYAAPGRYGLRSMADRVKDIGGQLSIDSQPRRGTRVRVVVE